MGTEDPCWGLSDWDWGSKAGTGPQVQGPRLSDRDGAQGLGLKGRDCGSGTGTKA